MRSLFVLLLTVAVLAAGTPARSQSGADLVQACVANGGSPQMCRGLHQLLRIPGGVCRDATSDLPECAIFDGIELDEALVLAQEHSWLNEALSLQRGLDDDQPLQDELWMHTHNSYNADAYPFQAGGGLDRNQIYTVGDQLRMGTRAIELDLHWAPHVLTQRPKAVQACHAEPITVPGATTLHGGCEIGSPLFTELAAEIKTWMDDNPEEVVMLYLENVLDGSAEAHNDAAATIASTFGDLVYRPASDCAALPMDTSRETIRESGARIIITGNCGPGGWGDLVHLRGSRWKEGGLDYGDDFPAYPCTARRTADGYETNWIRHWGDETGLSAAAQAGGDVTPADARNMTRCGVNMIGFDNLVPFDERTVNLVWSWRTNEPSTNDARYCASHDASGRFGAADCSVTVEKKRIKRPGRRAKVKRIEHFTAQPFACFDGTNWSVTTASGRFSDGSAVCAQEGRGAFSVPWNGYENERLKDAKPSGIAEVWLNYRATGSGWAS